MKTKYYIIALVIVFLSSCSNFLDEYNPNKINKTQFYNTEEDMEMALNGTYAALRGNGYYKNMYLYTEVRSDNTELQDPGANSGVPYQFENYTLTSDNSNVKTHWADLYKCITRANIILDHLPNVPFKDQNHKIAIEAEAKFLRALSYFHLVTQFGDVPIVTRELKTKDEIMAHTKRDPKAKVYNLITSDLDFVILSTLPNLQKGEETGRVSKVAAYSLMGKVKLHQAADNSFSSEKKSLLNMAKINLETAWSLKPFTFLSEIKYGDVFNKDTQVSCPEIIFQVMYLGGNSDLSSDFAWMFQPSSESGLTSRKSGSGLNLISKDMFDSYESGDIRKDISCGSSAKRNYVTKYVDLDDANGYGANNWIVLRYADVALMLAEVKYKLNEADAVTYLNMVRKRAGLSDYSGNNLRDGILKERRVELAFENQRWYDLLRLFSNSELISYMSAKNPNFNEKDLLLPIPFDENKLNPEGMYQNPMYK